MYFSLKTLVELWIDLLLPPLQVALSLPLHCKEQGSPSDPLVPSPVWTTWRERPCCFRELWDSGSAGENRKSKVKVRDKRAARVSARVFNVGVRNHRKPLVETLFY